MSSVCFVVKRLGKSLRKHKYPFFIQKTTWFLRHRNLHTTKRLVTDQCNLSSAHLEAVLYIMFQYSDSSTLWWAVLVQHIFSSLFGLLPLPHIHGSHKELFRVNKTYSSYYCFTLNFFWKRIIPGILGENKPPCGFPGTWGFGMFSDNIMQRGVGASVL